MMAEDSKKPARLGRPTKPPVQGERVQLGVQVNPDVKLRLEAEADRKSRSLSREAELRLERSFERQDLLPDVLGATYSPPLAGLLMALGLIMTHAGLREYWARSTTVGFNDHWINDPTAFDEALRGAFALLNFARPAGLPDKPVVSPPPGVQFANAMIDALEGEPSLLAGVGAIRALLGPITQRMIEARARQSTAQPNEADSKPPPQTGLPRDSKQLRSVPLLTASEAMELSAFKNLDPSRFPSAGRIQTRFPCGPRAFALRIRSWDNRPSWNHGGTKGDILVLDPDERPRVGDWVLAKIDERPKLAELCLSKDDGGGPIVLITPDARVHPAECARAVVTESTKGRPAAARVKHTSLSETA
jgi:hypothetical protein